MKSNGKLSKVEEILNKYSKKVFNIAYYLTGNYQDAQDLSQEAFVKVITAINTGMFDTDLPMESYLYKLIKNLYIDILRKKTKTKIVSLENPATMTEQEKNEIAHALLSDLQNDPQIVIEKKIKEEKILSALEQIPADFRMPVILCDIEGFSYKEISKILKCSIGTVRSRIHRGRKYLSKILGELLGERNEL